MTDLSLYRNVAAARRGWSVVCDFDGTISEQDVMDTLLERFGRPQWRALERAWLAGEIGSRACMQAQVALLDMSGAELDAHLETIRLDPEFGDFVALTRRLGVPLSISSDGLDYAIARLLERAGLQGLAVSANHLSPDGDARGWSLASPHQAAGCDSGTCKCAQLGAQDPGGTMKTLLIGDGASDFCAARQADFVFAKSSLADYCQAARIPHRPITGFADAIALLPELLAGALRPQIRGIGARGAVGIELPS